MNINLFRLLNAGGVEPTGAPSMFNSFDTQPTREFLGFLNEFRKYRLNARNFEPSRSAHSLLFDPSLSQTDRLAPGE